MEDGELQIENCKLKIANWYCVPISILNPVSPISNFSIFNLQFSIPHLPSSVLSPQSPILALHSFRSATIGSTSVAFRVGT